LGRLGWSRSAPGAGGHAADEAAPRSSRFSALRRSSPSPSAQSRPRLPAPTAASAAEEEPYALRALGQSRSSAPHTSTMVCKTLFALCIFTAGLRVQSLPSSAPFPVSLPANALPSTAGWTSAPRSPPASPTSGAPGHAVLPAPASAPAPTRPRNVSAEPGEAGPSSPASPWGGPSAEASPASGG
ncbi:unnamed protein product, partial [Gulo gulo]